MITVNGKTDEEYIEMIQEGLIANSFNDNNGDILDKINDCMTIKLYVNKDGGVIRNDTIEFLKELKEPISERLKQELNIDDNWDDEYYEIEVEPILKMLFYLDREELLSVCKDIMTCLCR